jgi:uncharacterized protein
MRAPGRTGIGAATPGEFKARLAEGARHWRIFEMLPALQIPIIALLAFGVGFATQRGSICSILAARQIAETGRATRLVAFITATLWALVIVVPLSWFSKGSIFLSPSYDISIAAFLGGALYGLGTFINGGCMFGTVAHRVG